MGKKKKMKEKKKKKWKEVIREKIGSKVKRIRKKRKGKAHMEHSAD